MYVILAHSLDFAWVGLLAEASSRSCQGLALVHPSLSITVYDGHTLDRDIAHAKCYFVSSLQVLVQRLKEGGLDDCYEVLEFFLEDRGFLTCFFCS